MVGDTLIAPPALGITAHHATGIPKLSITMPYHLHPPPPHTHTYTTLVSLMAWWRRHPSPGRVRHPYPLLFLHLRQSTATLPSCHATGDPSWLHLIIMRWPRPRPSQVKPHERGWGHRRANHGVQATEDRHVRLEPRINHQN
jgi:hypothetical protein